MKAALVIAGVLACLGLAGLGAETAQSLAMMESGLSASQEDRSKLLGLDAEVVTEYGSEERGCVPSQRGHEQVSASAEFGSYTVWIDCGELELAAWQLAIHDRAKVSQLVGIEGAADGAFAEPPHYDPAALGSERILLAAFSLDESLPSGRIRVATLHLRIEAGRVPDFGIKLEAAGGRDGRPLKAQVELTRES